MTIKLDTMAVPANHAMSVKTRVELNFPSPSLEKGEAIFFNSYKCKNGRLGQKGREVYLFISLYKYLLIET